MAKPKSEKPAPKSSGITYTKQPGVQITVTGQVAIRHDIRRDVKKYEEVFIIPASLKESALSVVLRCLLPHRLTAKMQDFGHIRTHEIMGGITDLQDAGIGDLYKKNPWDMTSEEIRQFALFIGLQSPDYRMIDGKKKLIRTLDAVAIIKATPLDFDLKDKVEKFLKEKAPKAPVVEEDPEEEEAGEEVPVGTEGAKQKWESLD